MSNPQLVDYIRKARSAGYSDEEIKNNLKSVGWEDRDISEAYREFLGISVPMRMPPQPKQIAQPQQTAQTYPKYSRMISQEMAKPGDAYAREEKQRKLPIIPILAGIIMILLLAAIVYAGYTLFISMTQKSPDLYLYVPKDANMVIFINYERGKDLELHKALNKTFNFSFEEYEKKYNSTLLSTDGTNTLMYAPDFTFAIDVFGSNMSQYNDMDLCFVLESTKDAKEILKLRALSMSGDYYVLSEANKTLYAKGEGRVIVACTDKREVEKALEAKKTGKCIRNSTFFSDAINKTDQNSFIFFYLHIPDTKGLFQLEEGAFAGTFDAGKNISFEAVFVCGKNDCGEKTADTLDTLLSAVQKATDSKAMKSLLDKIDVEGEDNTAKISFFSGTDELKGLIDDLKKEAEEKIDLELEKCKGKGKYSIKACYENATLMINDREYCPKLPKNYSFGCYVKTAKSAEDLKQICKEEDSEECIAKAFLSAQYYSYIPKEDAINLCKSLKKTENRDYCYFGIAESYYDFTICKNITSTTNDDFGISIKNACTHRDFDTTMVYSMQKASGFLYVKPILWEIKGSSGNSTDEAQALIVFRNSGFNDLTILLNDTKKESIKFYKPDSGECYFKPGTIEILDDNGEVLGKANTAFAQKGEIFIVRGTLFSKNPVKKCGGAVNDPYSYTLLMISQSEGAYDYQDAGTIIGKYT